ncbi:hypothetical protein CJ030_MR7G016938 [Morella rubra]|uniref:Uncharacterized protein n=1 Tax=Morella rubra TaxID=262757 RepID=A0A6A1V1Q0_9ROSI|nr:hypothetical protein CJ030_MR7G016938 [Morella rubra]
MATMEGINPNHNRQGSSSISNPEGDMVTKESTWDKEYTWSWSFSWQGAVCASSQPTARHLQLLDELEPSTEDEVLHGEEEVVEDEGEDESITGRFRSLDEL